MWLRYCSCPTNEMMHTLHRSFINHLHRCKLASLTITKESHKLTRLRQGNFATITIYVFTSSINVVELSTALFIPRSTLNKLIMLISSNSQ